MNHREKIVEAVAAALPGIDRSAAELATAVVLSFRMDELHYAKDEKPQPRIREVGSAERYDGYKGRNGR